MKGYLEADDFKSADVKKIGSNLYRSRLDIRHRLLFSLYQYQGECYALILECILHHAYDKSRFLQHGATVDEDKIPSMTAVDDALPDLPYINQETPIFHVLDKVISFDADQRAVYELQPPMMIIGSAGSGKTALTLEKMKHALGDVLYVTHSPYLVRNSRDIYYAQHYTNEDQAVDFLSYQEFLQSIQVPKQREANFADFRRWFVGMRTSRHLNDPHQLFEEFKGVLTGSVTEKACLERDDYLALGIKQSIFSEQERNEVYKLFESYCAFIEREGLYDSNMLSYDYAAKVEPRYDFIVIDEVQDITSVQLALILKSLHVAGDFIICGDSNQIVHPNFFSWAKVKSFFYRQRDAKSLTHDLVTVLNVNYRNSPQVTEVSNRLLKLKNARFGSIDKESNYLVKSNAHQQGQLFFLQDQDAIKRELDKKTRQSTRFAVVVMQEEQKHLAQKYFGTPLIFSVREAKGLEYENIILFNFVSSDYQRYDIIAEGVEHDDLLGDDLTYARVKDKRDKSLEIFKFHINALYVAMTRAVKNLYIIEEKPEHALLRLIGLHDAQQSLELAEETSCFDEWREEAHKLEMQGKQDQADQIRRQILHEKKVPWTPLVGDALQHLYDAAITQGHKKSKLQLFEYALLHHDLHSMRDLVDSGFAPAKNPEKGLELMLRKYFTPYTLKNITGLLRQVDQYGVDFRDQFNHTPLMYAARFGHAALTQSLCDIGADRELFNNAGLTAFQIALKQACEDKKYAEKQLAEIYELLAPADITLQVDGRLFKILPQSMEYLLFSVMMGNTYRVIGLRDPFLSNGVFTAKLLEDELASFAILPDYRKKRQYISSILSKNERDREGRYNKKLFKRLKRGCYIINPRLLIRVGEQWKPVYKLLDLNMLTPVVFGLATVDEYYERSFTAFREMLNEEMEGLNDSEQGDAI